jgi:hypothetical protein
MVHTITGIGEQKIADFPHFNMRLTFGQSTRIKAHYYVPAPATHGHQDRHVGSADSGVSITEVIRCVEAAVDLVPPPPTVLVSSSNSALLFIFYFFLCDALCKTNSTAYPGGPRRPA